MIIAAVCVFPLGIQAARAEIIHFVNPAPDQPGHYNWRFEPGAVHWLDITRSSGSQTNLANGSSVSQVSHDSPWGDFNVHLVEDFSSSATVLGIADGWFHPTWCLGFGDAVQSYPVEIDWLVYAEHVSPSEVLYFVSFFPENQSGYMGVRTMWGQHGWIEAVRTGMSLSAFSWAYETVPGQPIRAGEVPTPGAAVVLVVGVLASAARRRRMTPA